MEFIPTPATLSAFTVAALILTLTPGPDMTLFLGRALTQGRLAGIAALLGASSGIIVHTLLAAFGISALIQASPTGFFILKGAGALYLLWLAFQAVRYGSSFALEAGEIKKSNFFNNWLTGIGINLLNPKIVLFFITFLPQFVSPNDVAATSKMLFLGMYFILLALVCSTIMIVMVDKLSDTLKRKPVITRIIDWVFAGVFSTFAVSILFTQRG